MIMMMMMIGEETFSLLLRSRVLASYSSAFYLSVFLSLCLKLLSNRTPTQHTRIRHLVVPYSCSYSYSSFSPRVHAAVCAGGAARLVVLPHAAHPLQDGLQLLAGHGR